MVKYVVCLVMLALPLTACSGERKDMKSPCAGTEGSPCGPHKPVNAWWLA